MIKGRISDWSLVRKDPSLFASDSIKFSKLTICLTIEESPEMTKSLNADEVMIIPTLDRREYEEFLNWRLNRLITS